MFGINLLGTTFGKISGKKFKPLTQSVVVPRKCQRFFVFKALHAFTIIGAAKQLAGLKSWADRQHFPLAWIGSGHCVMFFRGDFLPVSTTNFIKCAHGA